MVVIFYDVIEPDFSDILSYRYFDRNSMNSVDNVQLDFYDLKIEEIFLREFKKRKSVQPLEGTTFNSKKKMQ